MPFHGSSGSVSKQREFARVAALPLRGQRVDNLLCDGAMTGVGSAMSKA